MQKTHDLTQPFRPGMPRMKFMPEPVFEVLQELDGRRCKISQLHMCTHLGTHVDAPAHYVAGGKPISAYPLEHFIVPAVVCPGDVGARGLISTECVKGFDILPGDAVLFSTGWGEKSQESSYYDHPYLTLELAEWLVGRRVSFIGVDFLTPEMPLELRDASWNAPIHRTLLANEVLIIENLRGLSPLAGKRVRLVAAPIMVEASVEAAPARVFAFENTT